jgi:hypothetical protein
MEKCPMITDWQNQYCKNGYTTKSNLYVQCSTIRIPITFTIEIENSTVKFIWKYKRPWIAKTKLSKKNNIGGFTILDFKLYYRAMAIKTAWYWHKNRYEEQWKRIEDSDMNPWMYTNLIFDKGAQNIWWTASSTNAARKTGYLHAENWN